MTGAENVPHQGAIVDEYREGCDKCIERRSGPGEDVEVEIIKDAYQHTELEEKIAEKIARADAIVKSLKSRMSPPHNSKS